MTHEDTGKRHQDTVHFSLLPTFKASPFLIWGILAIKISFSPAATSLERDPLAAPSVAGATLSPDLQAAASPSERVTEMEICWIVIFSLPRRTSSPTWWGTIWGHWSRIHDISMTILCKKRNKATLRTLRACKSSMPVTTSCVSPMRACFINLLDAALVIFCFTRALAYDLQALGRQRMFMFSTCFHPREKLRLASPTLKIWLSFSNLGTARLRGWGSYQSWLFWRGDQPCYSDTPYSTPQFQWIVIICYNSKGQTHRAHLTASIGSPYATYAPQSLAPGVNAESAAGKAKDQHPHTDHQVRAGALLHSDGRWDFHGLPSSMMVI